MTDSGDLKLAGGGLSAWGGGQTKFFFDLTPERVLEAVEEAGFRCTGRCAALNSFENRVYDVELEIDGAVGDTARDRVARHRILKFYRPGRWSETQILEEHRFLADLRAAEIPAVAPAAFPDGSTLHASTAGGIWFTVFPKVGGRAPDELSDEQLTRIGRLLGRVHNVGASSNSSSDSQSAASHRILIGPETYGRANLEFLLQGNWIPVDFSTRYEAVVGEILRVVGPWFDGIPVHRIHGDCHLGNLLSNQDGYFFVDFDDMVRGPAVQDVWLLVPGRDAEAIRQRSVLLEGYEEMRAFDRASLRLIEPLRALRFIHYTAWIARRWQDPAFPAAFPEFGTHHYWADETQDLEDQLKLIREL